ncbi:hypothetical protein [Streptomyces sp. NPDC127098]|uniref:hypothetical protein n=1 Tax=Streptomyces sp. NPDC127098 TaxID=3347137 RepID=UPI0036688569
MCGGCGGREPTDWARGLHAGPPARAALAAAATRLADRRGLRAVARPGGWLVTTPTGSTVPCHQLTTLVGALRRAVGAPPAPPPPDPGHVSGRLTVPPPDARTPVHLRIAPGAPPVTGADGHWTAPTDEAALPLLASLATGPHALRHYLAEISGGTAAWAGPALSPSEFAGATPERAADLLTWVEWCRQAGTFTTTPLAARLPLAPEAELDLEIRAGQVVRATTAGRRPA